MEPCITLERDITTLPWSLPSYWIGMEWDFWNLLDAQIKLIHASIHWGRWAWDAWTAHHNGFFWCWCLGFIRCRIHCHTTPSSRIHCHISPFRGCQARSICPITFGSTKFGTFGTLRKSLGSRLLGWFYDNSSIVFKVPGYILHGWGPESWRFTPKNHFRNLIMESFWGPNQKTNCCLRLVASRLFNSSCICTISGSDSIDMEAPLKSSQPLTRVEELRDLLSKLFSVIKAKIPNRCMVFWRQNLVQNCSKTVSKKFRLLPFFSA